ncbi:MAG TPA: methylmalonyl-CoA epimerase [Mucilaginibacter sp.]|nr:methylmalonyl-CoA epimerase [Mucilaginibacter sp.]
MNKIEHIGIAVNNLQSAGDLYEKLLNTTVYKVEEVLSEGVRTAFLQCGPNKIELLEATNADSAVARFIDKKGEGIHHIAFEVDDIKAEMARLKSDGFTLLNDEPKRGADNKLVCFVHPKSANGVLIELCESRDFPSKAKQLSLNTAEKLNLFEFRNQLLLPDDLKAHFMLSDDEIKAYDQNMFVFYKFDEFKSVKEDIGDFGGIPDYREIIHTLPQHENCFVFIDHMITSSVYAIRLYKHKCDVNEVYVIVGNQFKVVAKSFTEFISIYQNDSRKLFF